MKVNFFDLIMIFNYFFIKFSLQIFSLENESGGQAQKRFKTVTSNFSV